MIQEQIISPEYLSIYVSGPEPVTIPVDHDYRRLIATDKCINIPCRYWNEGDTRVQFGASSDVKRTDAPRFEGIIKTPGRKVMVYDANIPEIFSMAVPTELTRIRVWTNDVSEPDDILIAVG